MKNIKRWLKFIGKVFIVIAIIYVIAFAVLAIKGKEILIRKLQGLTQKKVTMKYFRLIPPFDLKIKKLDIDGMFKADYIYLSPNILGLVSGSLILNDIRMIRPSIIYEKSLFSKKDKPQVKASSPVRVICRRIEITDGRLNFIDKAAGKEGLSITVEELNFRLVNIYAFPFSVVTKFELTGKIPWQEGVKKGNIDLHGWMDIFKKDMQASLKVSDIDGIYLYPYYSTWVDLGKARIQKAVLNFSSDIQGLDNNITAACHLELAEIVRRPLSPEESEKKAARITDAVLDIFKAMNQGKIALDFTIKTKMDKPEFSFGDIKMAFEDKLSQGKTKAGFRPQDLLILPGKMIEGTFKGAAELSQALINSTVSIGKEIRNTVEDAFKKETPVQPENTTANSTNATNTTAPR